MQDTSWNKSAKWYNELLSNEGTYQKDLILPNLLRLVSPKPGEKILDLGCGQGFFCREFDKSGAKITGVDNSSKLIEIAKKNSSKSVNYFVGSADNLTFIKETFDKIILVLSLQNMEKADLVIKECAKKIKKGGSMYLVLNHPCFRIPGASGWEWDEENKIQYRRMSAYLSEKKNRIVMHPGEKNSEVTFSFHRPLQYYFKHLQKAGFAVERIEEWVSEKKTTPGPRAVAIDRSRAEFPLFLFIQAKAV